MDHRVLEPFVMFLDHLNLERRKLKHHIIREPKEKLLRVVIKGDLLIEGHLVNHLKVPLEEIEFPTMMSIWTITLKM